MSTKKESRYVLLATGAYMKLNLDPDIYDAATNTKLGVLSVIAGAAKSVPVTLAQAAKSSNAILLKCRIEKGAGDAIESRIVKLICDATKVDDAKVGSASLIGDTLKIGGAVTSNWTIRSVA